MKSGASIYFCPICYTTLSGEPCTGHGFKTRFAGHFAEYFRSDDKMKSRVCDVLSLVEKVSKDLGGIVEWLVFERVAKLVTGFGSKFVYDLQYDALTAYLQNYYFDHVLRILTEGTAELCLALYVEVSSRFKPASTTRLGMSTCFTWPHNPRFSPLRAS